MFELWQLPLLLATGLAAGFVDSIAGGGGLISLPVLLGLGYPPPLALGTNKLQAVFGSASATWQYAHGGTMRLLDCGRGLLWTLTGAVAGSLCVQWLDPALLRKLIPVMLILSVGVLVLRPHLGHADHPPKLGRPLFDGLFGLTLGFYDGFFGPGVGTFWAMAFMLVLGFNLTRATGYTKAMNFASNLGALAVFAAAGQVLVVAGLVMGAGQLLGARLGARMVLRRGTRFIRPVFITVVLALTSKLLYDAYFKRS